MSCGVTYLKYHYFEEYNLKLEKKILRCVHIRTCIKGVNNEGNTITLSLMVTHDIL